MGKIRIGISGWRYADWRGDFYPLDLPHRRELEYASRRFPTLELNGSFYSLQTASSYGRWHAQTPPGFRLAVKGGRYITHFLRLKRPRGALANFFASGLLRLGDKLGPVLWQLPPDMTFDPERLESFLACLPGTASDAAELAREHGPQVAPQDAWLETDGRRRIRHVLEVRHESFLVPELVSTLRSHGVALAFSEAADWPYVEELTAGFVYLRLHGAMETYRSRYSDEDLERLARRVRAWHGGAEPRDPRRITGRVPPARKTRDVWVYFDNTDKRHAPRDACRLMALLESEEALARPEAGAPVGVPNRQGRCRLPP